MDTENTERYMDGYITVKVEGLNPERFINMTAKNNITMWDVKRTSYTSIELKMYYYQYPMLRGILRKTGCKSKILKKKGLHFVINKARRRAFFAGGLVLFLSILIYLSSFIWFVEITGNEKIESNLIYSYAEAAGLKAGVHKDRINLRNVEKNIITQIEQVSVVNIKYKGTRAIINIVERTMPPEIINADEGVNIIASRDGIIDTILSYRGQVMVNQGQYVKKGQLLISGEPVDEFGEAVHALGLVTARTWYESIQDIATNYSEDIRTGEVKRRIHIEIGSKKLYVKKNSISYEKYDKIEKITDIKVLGMPTPLKKITEYYYEKETVFSELTYEEAFEIALEKAEEEIKQSMPANAELEDRKVEREQQDEGIKVRVLYTVIENISQEQRIDQ